MCYVLRLMRIAHTSGRLLGATTMLSFASPSCMELTEHTAQPQAQVVN